MSDYKDRDLGELGFTKNERVWVEIEIQTDNNAGCTDEDGDVWCRIVSMHGDANTGGNWIPAEWLLDYKARDAKEIQEVIATIDGIEAFLKEKK